MSTNVTDGGYFDTELQRRRENFHEENKHSTSNERHPHHHRKKRVHIHGKLKHGNDGVYEGKYSGAPQTIPRGPGRRRNCTGPACIASKSPRKRKHRRSIYEDNLLPSGQKLSRSEDPLGGTSLFGGKTDNYGNHIMSPHAPPNIPDETTGRNPLGRSNSIYDPMNSPIDESYNMAGVRNMVQQAADGDVDAQRYMQEAISKEYPRKQLTSAFLQDFKIAGGIPDYWKKLASYFPDFGNFIREAQTNLPPSERTTQSVSEQQFANRNMARSNPPAIDEYENLYGDPNPTSFNGGQTINEAVDEQIVAKKQEAHAALDSANALLESKLVGGPDLNTKLRFKTRPTEQQRQLEAVEEVADEKIQRAIAQQEVLRGLTDNKKINMEDSLRETLERNALHNAAQDAENARHIARNLLSQSDPEEIEAAIALSDPELRHEIEQQAEENRRIEALPEEEKQKLMQEERMEEERKMQEERRRMALSPKEQHIEEQKLKEERERREDEMLHEKMRARAATPEYLDKADQVLERTLPSPLEVEEKAQEAAEAAHRESLALGARPDIAEDMARIAHHESKKEDLLHAIPALGAIKERAEQTVHEANAEAKAADAAARHEEAKVERKVAEEEANKAALEAEHQAAHALAEHAAKAAEEAASQVEELHHRGLFSHPLPKLDPKDVLGAIPDDVSEVALKNSFMKFPLHTFGHSEAANKEEAEAMESQYESGSELRNKIVKGEHPSNLNVIEGEEGNLVIAESAKGVGVKKGRVFYSEPAKATMDREKRDTSKLVHHVNTGERKDIPLREGYYVAEVANMELPLPSPLVPSPPPVLRGDDDLLDVSMASGMMIDEGVLTMTPWKEYARNQRPEVHESMAEEMSAEEKEALEEEAKKAQELAATKREVITNADGSSLVKVTPPYGVTEHIPMEEAMENLIEGGAKTMEEAGQQGVNTMQGTAPIDSKPIASLNVTEEKAGGVEEVVKSEGLKAAAMNPETHEFVNAKNAFNEQVDSGKSAMLEAAKPMLQESAMENASMMENQSVMGNGSTEIITEEEKQAMAEGRNMTEEERKKSMEKKAEAMGHSSGGAMSAMSQEEKMTMMEGKTLTEEERKSMMEKMAEGGHINGEESMTQEERRAMMEGRAMTEEERKSMMEKKSMMESSSAFSGFGSASGSTLQTSGFMTHEHTSESNMATRLKNDLLSNAQTYSSMLNMPSGNYLSTVSGLSVSTFESFINYVLHPSDKNAKDAFERATPNLKVLFGGSSEEFSNLALDRASSITGKPNPKKPHTVVTEQRVVPKTEVRATYPSITDLPPDQIVGGATYVLKPKISNVTRNVPVAITRKISGDTNERPVVPVNRPNPNQVIRKFNLQGGPITPTNQPQPPTGLFRRIISSGTPIRNPISSTNLGTTITTNTGAPKVPTTRRYTALKAPAQPVKGQAPHNNPTQQVPSNPGVTAKPKFTPSQSIKVGPNPPTPATKVADNKKANVPINSDGSIKGENRRNA
ncbi:Polar tube protein 3 [Astathelohania contejeani]|uniref:Polar tube protein 3 n=1 Tax=Astathelohania contejeani TaxID=164912 RepID=A0ABQ7HXZ1_9MICR|nr:Polar tube protein 3 [Thelohania contejeani]